MLHCTACRSVLAPFSFYQPFVDKHCPTCGVPLRFHRRGRRRVEVEGPTLPPLPPLLEDLGDVGSPGTYRDAPTEPTLRLRWRDPFGPADAALVGFTAASTVAGVTGAILVHPLALVVAFPGLAVHPLHRWMAWPARGELLLGATELSARVRTWRVQRLTVPRDAVRLVRVVPVTDQGQLDTRHFRVTTGLANGEWADVARPRSHAAAQYMAARLRQVLGVDAE